MSIRKNYTKKFNSVFEQIQSIKDLKENLHLVEALALSSLDEVTVSSFIAFVNDELTQLIEPDEILDAKDFQAVKSRLEDVSVDKNGSKELTGYLQFVQDFI